MHEEQNSIQEQSNQTLNYDILNKIYEILQTEQKNRIDKEKEKEKLDKKQLEKEKKDSDHKLNQEQFYLDFVKGCKEFNTKSLEYQETIVKSQQDISHLLQVNIVCLGLVFGLLCVFMFSSFFISKK